MEPTEIQKSIIENDGNTVVLASPGSGKTFVMSEKIRRVLCNDAIRPYQGVIAISYTRKASANLKHRALSDGTNVKNSFFGTIDNFCLTQIVLDFGYHVFGHPQSEIDVLPIGDLSTKEQEEYKWIDGVHPEFDKIQDEQIDGLKNLFLKGIVLINSLELLALYILRNSKACRNYMKARFKYVFVDEFQDADTYTNDIFLMLVGMGIVGVAVGDENQSIFGFAHKNKIYLGNLRKNKEFTSFSLNHNFRCSLPIINYSERLLNEHSKVYETDEDGMYYYVVNGDERSIADFIDNELEAITQKLSITDYSNVAVLARDLKTQKIIDESLEIPHRVIETTDLDKDLNPRSRLYTYLLRYYCDDSYPFFRVLDEFVDYDALSTHDKKRLMEQSNIIRSIEDKDREELISHFKAIADILFYRIAEGTSTKLLKHVISNERDFDSYRPVNSDEIQIMTLHKSKGLEFDVVFHLNMSDWELPYKQVTNGDFNNPIYPTWNQDLDLHYVGITRAKKACYLIRGTRRTNKNFEIKVAHDSEFLSINQLDTLRKDYFYEN